jgi:MFS family permease
MNSSNPSPTDADTLSSVDRRPLIGLLSATGFAQTGNILSLVVVPWLVYQITGSGAQTGLVGFAAAAPLVLAGLFGGVFIDRIGHARTALLAEVFSGIFLALIPILHLSIGLEVWAIAALVFISNLFSAPGMAARRSLVPDVAGRAAMTLERANSLEQVMNRLPQLLGPLAAGALMAVFHPASVMWLTVAMVWMSALSIAVAVRDAAPSLEQPPGSYWSDLAEGFRFVMQDRLMRVLIVVLAASNFLEAPLSIIMPIYADQILGGPVDLGIVMAALGIGLLIGVGLYAVVGHRLPRRWVFIGGLCGIGLSYWGLAMLPGLWVAVTILFLLGILAGPVNPMLSTIYQERVPANMRGRVFGLAGAISLSMMPFGRLLGGMVIDWFGLSTLLVVQAVGFAGIGAALLMLPALRLLDAGKPTVQARIVEAGPLKDPQPDPGLTNR